MSGPAGPNRSVASTSRVTQSTSSPPTLAVPSSWLWLPAGSRSKRDGVPPALAVAAAALAVLPFLWDLVRVAAHANGRVVFYGDEALEALATRDAWHGTQLLGPYSRFVWHHPGPALFYLLAVPDRLLSSTGAGMLIGILLLNALAVAAVVVVVGRRAGPWAALWAAGALGLIHFGMNAVTWHLFWNPYAVILPMLLLVVLAADAATGTVASFCWALVAGSFVVQTHVSTAPTVAAVLLVSLLALAFTRWRARTVRHSRRGDAHQPRAVRVAVATAVAGLVVTVAMWVPPLIDAVDHHPSNLRLLWSFFITRHPTHSLRAAVETSLTSAVISPLGRAGPIGAEFRRSTRTLTLAAVVLAAIAVAAIVIGVWRRRRFGPWLAVTSLVGFGAAVISGTRVVGPIAEYLTLWEAFLPVTLLIALGASILERAPARELKPTNAITRRSLLTSMAGILAAAVTVGAALTGAAVGVDQTARLASPLHYTGPPVNLEVTQAALMVRSAMSPKDRVVRLTMVTDPAWPIAAGVALELERDGYRTTVAGATRDWTALFGTSRRATGKEDTDVEFYEPAPPAVQGPPPEGHPLGTVGPVQLFLNGT